MKPISYLLIISIITACSSIVSIRKTKQALLPSVTELITVLSHDSLQGRKHASQGFDKAALYVEQQLTTIGVKPLFGNSYKDTVSGFYGYNIVGVIETPTSTNEYIILSAHLDHLGIKTRNTQDSIYNGANDNASGVAAVLKIAEELSKHSFSKKIIIALFTAEETGLNGSFHLAKKLKTANIPVAYVINIDMIGSQLPYAPNKVFVTGFSKSNFAALSNSAINETFFVQDSVEVANNLFRYSDNFSFYRVLQIPAHTISTFNMNNFDCYHKACDEIATIDIQNVEIIIKKTTQIIIELLKNNSEIALTK